MDERHSEVARRFRAGLEALYGPRLKALFSWCADEDEVEVVENLVVLDDFEWVSAENERVSYRASELSLESGIVVGWTVAREADWRRWGPGSFGAPAWAAAA